MPVYRYEILHAKGDDGRWTSSVSAEPGAPPFTATDPDGTKAEQVVIAAVLRHLADVAAAGGKLPPEVASLFSRRFA